MEKPAPPRTLPCSPAPLPHSHSTHHHNVSAHDRTSNTTRKPRTDPINQRYHQTLKPHLASRPHTLLIPTSSHTTHIQPQTTRHLTQNTPHKHIAQHKRQEVIPDTNCIRIAPQPTAPQAITCHRPETEFETHYKNLHKQQSTQIRPQTTTNPISTPKPTHNQIKRSTTQDSMKHTYRTPTHNPTHHRAC